MLRKYYGIVTKMLRNYYKIVTKLLRKYYELPRFSAVAYDILGYVQREEAGSWSC